MTDVSSSSESSPQQERLVYAPISDLRVGKNAPPSAKPASTLVDSIRTYGVLQPLLARPGADGYELVVGFKRLAAAKEAGLKEVPVRVYRVEDEAVQGLYEASNVREGGRHRVPAAPMGEYRATGKLGGMIEEELNRSPTVVPYKSIMTVAAIILVLIWGGIIVRKRWPAKDPGQLSQPQATAQAQEGGIELPPPDSGVTTSRVSVARWQLLFSDVEGVEVRNESGIPRIVFESPVFSRLTTIDPAQKTRLERVVRLIINTNPASVLSIIGHTDNDPIRPSSEYRSNEYLSELRANAVVDYIKGTNLIPPSKLRSVAMGASDPPFSNASADSKTKNRTVSIEIMQPTN